MLTPEAADDFIQEYHRNWEDPSPSEVTIRAVLAAWVTKHFPGPGIGDEVNATGWVKCSDRMPPRAEGNENTWVLALVQSGARHDRIRLVNWCHAGGGHWRNEDDYRTYFEVSHWMPLPSPPLNSEGERT